MIDSRLIDARDQACIEEDLNRILALADELDERVTALETTDSGDDPENDSAEQEQ